MIYVFHVPGLKKWDTTDQITNILNDLEQYKDKLVGIDLCHNSVGEECAKAISEKLQNLPHLRKIKMKDCFVSRGLEELPKCLKYLLDSVSDKKITELDLSDNALGPSVIPSFEKFFKENKTLEKLQLNNCGMGPVGTPQLVEFIVENKQMPLKSLKISRNNLNLDGGNSIAKLLEEKNDITELSISDNELPKEAMIKIFDVVKKNKNIKSFDIHNNLVSKDGIKILNQILPELQDILCLDLSDISVDNSQDDIKELFKLLPNLKKLREFSFEYNLSDQEMSAKNKKSFISELLDELLKLNSIKEISLGNNEFPKDLYEKYLPQFTKKGAYLFSCYSADEELEDVEDDDIDNEDLNK